MPILMCLNLPAPFRFTMPRAAVDYQKVDLIGTSNSQF